MMLGARTGAWAKSGGGVPTAKDYVQNGLVAMWDGIENARWGVHDASATEWKSLIGGPNFKNCSFSSDTCSVTSDSSPAFEGWPFSHVTVELVVARLAGTTQNHSATVSQYMRINGSASAFGFVAQRSPDNTKQYVSMMKLRQVEASDNPESRQYLAATYNYANGLETCNYYHNGVKIYTTTSQREIDFYSQTIYLSIRKNNLFNRISISSRALTAEEIAHNYAIDKARFNLP